MGYDLTRATRAAEMGGYDLSRAAQMTAGGPMALGKARQSPGTREGHDVAKATKGAKATGKAMPTRAKGKGR